MNLINQIFFAVLITSFTGMVALGCWVFLKDFIAERNIVLVYLMLKWICILYLIPMGYVLMQLTLRDGYLQVDELWQMNFSLSGIFWILSTAVAVIWGVYTSYCMFACIHKIRIQGKKYRRSFPEEDEAVKMEFLRVKSKLKIRRNIRLCRNYEVSSPGICGVFVYRLVLPDRKYTKQQLSVIFHHELMHYKSRDPFFRICSTCVSAMQHLNLFTVSLSEEVREWSELCCDMRAIEAISDEMNASCYFEMIMSSIDVTEDDTCRQYIFSGLYENRLRLERRIEYMKKYTKVKRVAKTTTALMAFVFALMSVTTTYAAGSQLAEAHDYIYQKTEVAASESATAELEERYLPASEDNTYDKIVYANPELEVISPLLNANESVQFQWSIDAGVRHLSSKFYVKSGQTISVAAAATPGNNTFWIGIQDSWNNVRYVEGTGSLGYNFQVTSSGNYRVIVQNRSNTTLTASGYYYYY